MNNIKFYLKDWRIIIGILLFIVAAFGPSTGEVFRSKWDDSLQYRKPIDSDERIGMVIMGTCALFFGIKARRKKLNELNSADQQDSSNA